MCLPTDQNHPFKLSVKARDTLQLYTKCNSGSHAKFKTSSHFLQCTPLSHPHKHYLVFAISGKVGDQSSSSYVKRCMVDGNFAMVIDYYYYHYFLELLYLQQSQRCSELAL